jgi:hypothetical protein
MKAQGHVGKTDDGDSVYVEITVTTETKEVQTVTHETADKVTRVSIQGHYFAKGSRRTDISGGGQCVDMVAAVTKPAMGITGEDIARLVEIWKGWHLNDMRAGCAHQTVVYEEDKYGRNAPSLDKTPRCPETGYRYGHAWLYEEPPADVLADLVSIGAKLDGTDGGRD